MKMHVERKRTSINNYSFLNITSMTQSDQDIFHDFSSKNKNLAKFSRDRS